MTAGVGFVGLGRMGLPMCLNLVRAGHEVLATDCRDQLESDLVAAGAGWRPSPAAVASEADVLMTMLPGPCEVRDVMVGSGGALRAMRPGATWIDMSSCSPAVGREIAPVVEDCGVHWLDAPVGGGPQAAAAATLQLFVGGDAGTVEQHRSLLQTLADPARILHVGSNCAGYTTKLLVNLIWFGQAIATAEALLLGRRAGIELEPLRRALDGSAAASEFIRHDLDALLAGDYLTTFGLHRCCEELESIATLARELEVPFELSELVARVHGEALSRYGPVDGELLAVALLEERAGMLLRSDPV